MSSTTTCEHVNDVVVLRTGSAAAIEVVREATFVAALYGASGTDGKDGSGGKLKATSEGKTDGNSSIFLGGLFLGG